MSRKEYLEWLILHVSKMYGLMMTVNAVAGADINAPEINEDLQEINDIAWAVTRLTGELLNSR